MCDFISCFVERKPHNPSRGQAKISQHQLSTSRLFDLSHCLLLRLHRSYGTAAIIAIAGPPLLCQSWRAIEVTMMRTGKKESPMRESGLVVVTRTIIPIRIDQKRDASLHGIMKAVIQMILGDATSAQRRKRRSTESEAVTVATKVAVVGREKQSTTNVC